MYTPVRALAGLNEIIPTKHLALRLPTVNNHQMGADFTCKYLGSGQSPVPRTCGS